MLPELDVARVQRWLTDRNDKIPPDARDKIRIEADIDARSITIVECRPPWRNDIGPAWTRFPIVRLRYATAHREWSLYWRDRHLHFHYYDQTVPTQRIDELLAEIDRDPTGIFWG